MSPAPSSSVSSLPRIDLPAPYDNKYVKFLCGIYGSKPSNRIFDLDHSATLVAISYSTYLADPRKFLWRYKDDPHLVVILNTHIDDHLQA
jgi:hypothetical protein